MTTRKIRTRDIHGDFGYRGNDEGGRWLPADGEQRYLIRAKPLFGEAVWVLSRVPGRTNSSHEARVEGWLGTTDDVDYDAEGYWEVVGRSRTHLHLRRLDAQTEPPHQETPR